MDTEDVSSSTNTSSIFSPCNNCNLTVFFPNDTSVIPSEVDLLAVVRISLFGAFAVFGNFMVILSVILNDELRATRYAFMASLASVDSLTGLYFGMGAMMNGSPQTLSENPLFCVYAYCGLFFLWSASIFHMVLIATDRYLTITKPFDYDLIMTRCRCTCLIVAAWLSGAAVAVLPLVGLNKQLPPHVVCLPSIVMSGEYLMFLCLGTFFVPLVVMCVLYGRLARVAVVQRKKIHALHVSVNATRSEVVTVVSGSGEQPAPIASSSNPSDDAVQPSQAQRRRLKVFKQEMRTTKTLLMILGIFALCWLPFAFMLILEHTASNFHSLTLNDIAFSLGMMNSAVNPVVYAFRDVPLRKTFKKLLKCQKV